MEELRCDNCNRYLCLASGDLNCCEFYCNKQCEKEAMDKKEEEIIKDSKIEFKTVMKVTKDKNGKWTWKEETIKNPNYKPPTWIK